MTLIIQLSPLHLAHLQVQSLIFNSNKDKWQEIKIKEFIGESNRFHIHPKTPLSEQTPFLKILGLLSVTLDIMLICLFLNLSALGN